MNEITISFFDQMNDRRTPHMLEEGTTIEQFLDDINWSGDREVVCFAINGSTQDKNYVLKNGDRLSILPAKPKVAA